MIFRDTPPHMATCGRRSNGRCLTMAMSAVGVELAAWAAPLFIGLSLLEECSGGVNGRLPHSTMPAVAPNRR